jgi:hypothetical protein
MGGIKEVICSVYLREMLKIIMRLPEARNRRLNL